MAKEKDVGLAVEGCACGLMRSATAEAQNQKHRAPDIVLASQPSFHHTLHWGIREQPGDLVPGKDRACFRVRRSVSMFRHRSASALRERQLRRLQHGDIVESCGRLWRHLLNGWLIVPVVLVIAIIPLETRSEGLSSKVSSEASAGTSSRARLSQRAAEYMERFNVPQQNIDLVWLKSGGTVVQRGNKTYHFNQRGANVGVYAGYASMHDSSTVKYCERAAAKIDTQQTVGRPLMAAGACPNWGKVIAFTDSTGKVADTQRWENEIHGNVMPHSTVGCKSHAAPGSAEVAKNAEGMSMYAGYMVACPFSQAVYDNDMLPDGEYDPHICDFVTLQNKLWFLDTGRRSNGKVFTPFAFHGNGGHLGYDYEGGTPQVGCPPYSPPKRTSAMKDRSWLNDPFACSTLSRCTNHCWPFADGHRCFRSLPAMFDLETRECRLLGYHTQFFLKSDCAGSPTDDENKFYCVKPVKTAKTSSQVYLSSHLRPDYETRCPPREPLLKVQWGEISRSQYCQPLREEKTIGDITAEACGQAVFENSSSDDTSHKLADLHWATFTSDKCVNMDASCRAIVKGRCSLYNKPPECLFVNSGSISFTSLSAVDPLIAKAPDKVAVLPTDPCAAVDCGEHGSCSEGKCVCMHGWGGEHCNTPVPDCTGVLCQNDGHCDPDTGKCVCGPCFEGPACELKKENCCATQQDCGEHATCSEGTCVCTEGWGGEHCDTPVPDCTGVVCHNNGHCDATTGQCVCAPCFEGPTCESRKENCCVSQEDCGEHGTCSEGICVCSEGWGGEHCDTPVQDCTGVVCQNGGHCDAATGHCVCAPCFEGPTCELKKEDCCVSQEDCGEHGTCSDGLCVCSEGWGGAHCDTPVQDCTGVVCQNGGHCDAATGQCVCAPCFEGPTCESKKEDCCVSQEDCGEHGTCSDGLCVCSEGWGGAHCDTPAEGCTGVVCQNGGHCDATTGQCVCARCFEGPTCEVRKENCCVSQQDCGVHGTCSEGICICSQGWGGERCDTPVPDCNAGAICQNNGHCDAATGQCVCAPCFEGPTCESKIADCCASQADCGEHGTCSDGKCTCAPGWGGEHCGTPFPDCNAGAICQNNGHCDAATGHCVCAPCFEGPTCEVKEEKCCVSQEDCGEHGTCSGGRCVCNPGWGGDYCDMPVPSCNGGAICQNGGHCDAATGRCVCAPCFEGPTCESKKQNCCLSQGDCGNNGDCDAVSHTCICKPCYEGPRCSEKTPECCTTNTDCGERQECDAAANQCLCLPGYSGANCGTVVALCSETSCSGAGQCDPSTGRCTCNSCYYGKRCQKRHADCCQSNEECHGPREVCDPSSNQCKCDPKFAGPGCGELVYGTCLGWCTPPTHLKENSSECPDVDCLFLCCQSLVDCVQDANTEDCYTERMHALGGSCCLGKAETGNVVAIATAGGILGLLLLLAAVGAGVAYSRKKSRRAVGDEEQFVEFDTTAGGREEDSQEEAIEVNLDDFQSHLEGPEAANKALSTAWDT